MVRLDQSLNKDDGCRDGSTRHFRHFLSRQELANQALINVVRMGLVVGTQCHLRVARAVH
jgi:hypothetical protein